ncbi:MAG: prenyltransferase/squalene oxidase repeat-containing protein [Pirellulaceae bacterium]
MILDRLQTAYSVARQTLLDERQDCPYWEGELSASALSTATAISALALYERGAETSGSHRQETMLVEPERCQSLIDDGTGWLRDHQNEDGGWGDTDKSYSNVATTYLVMAAFHLAGQAPVAADQLARADSYLETQGRFSGLRKRYGKDKTFVVPILTNLALAGLVPWKEISALPFELAWLPQSFYRFLGFPVVSYAIPALVAIGQARYFHRPPWNPLTRLLRRAAIKPSLRVLEQMQPTSGGYLEAVPLTSFVVMSLAGTGRQSHPVTTRGIRFLIDSVRTDGSWPIDTNLATWNTTLALQALATGGEDLGRLTCLDWLLDCQHTEPHPFTGAQPGGWGWSDLSGAVPDSDDTPSALLALNAWRLSASCTDADRQRIELAAIAGINWLLKLQNRDGGWPTFCRGWGKLPFDRSGADLTAHALRALHAWQDRLPDLRVTDRQWQRLIDRGFRFLQDRQQPDGSWIPLWFGNQDHPQEENPVYGTAKVLLAYRDWQMTSEPVAQRGFQWLREAQQADGGWGGGPAMLRIEQHGTLSSVEETTLAVEAILADRTPNQSQQSINKGLAWIVERVETDRFRENSVVGFYFAKLWYHEKLYPLTFTVSALGQARQLMGGDRELNDTEQPNPVI